MVDANPTSRSVLVGHLRDLGFATVVQCARAADARRRLETMSYDLVLCEHYFEKNSATGQDLLDDLRRNQLLPFSTIFIMITGEASYAKVAEAAESALDGYLLKPHSASALAERLRLARTRKAALQDIFAAIEAEDYPRAAKLARIRFDSRGPFWLYAARIGAELMLRTGQHVEAQAMYEAIIAAKTFPWAKLGVARSMLEAGQPAKASKALSGLLSEEPGYADAYDVMGRAQFDLCQFDAALATFKMAVDLTPDSITRMQKFGMLMFYSGKRLEAEKILSRATALGLDSKMFDCQSLVLLAFARFEGGDRRGLQHCMDDFERVLERHPESMRLQRLASVVRALNLIQERKFAQVVYQVRAMADDIDLADYDFEAACNMIVLLAQMAQKAIQLEEVDVMVSKLGMRFCTSRPLSELLASTAAIHDPYAKRIRDCHAQVMLLSEQALQHSLAGDPAAAVRSLINHGQQTLNAKLIEGAYLVLQRYGANIEDMRALSELVEDLRTRFCAPGSRPSLGDPRQRQSGAVVLPQARAPA